MAKSVTRATVTVRRLWAALALAVAFTLFASVAMAGPQLGNSTPVECGIFGAGQLCTGNCELLNGDPGICQTDAEYNVCECVPEAGPPKNNPGKPFEQLEAKLDRIAADIAEIKALLEGDGNGTPDGCGALGGPGTCSGSCIDQNGYEGTCTFEQAYGLCECVPDQVIILSP